MSLVNLNYTGRIDIEPNELSVEYQIRDNKFVLRLKWMLGHYDLPEDCKLFVELKGGSQTSETHRIELGILGNGFGDTTLHLAQVRNPELIRVRFGVVAIDTNGLPLIKADRDRITPLNLDENHGPRSFLKLVRSPDLVVPWRVEFSDDEPILVVTDRHDLFLNLRDNAPLFLPLVLPEVVRQVFEWLALSELDYASTTIKHWVELYEVLACPRDFIERERARKDEMEIIEVQNMARVVSEEFSKKYKFIDQLASMFEE